MQSRLLAMIYERAKRSVAYSARSRNLTEDQVAGRIDPSCAVPTAPSASASAPVFPQALPPAPEPSAPPDDGNKPKAPRP